ncbi:MAG: DedA family protein, partial [Bacteroidaceae bacterium]|nr:DedA family protein [Bacteroidaceae bacterium]
PAAYKAATTGELNIFLVILFSTLGACIGAAVNYYLALYLGRPLIYRFAESRIGHMCLLDSTKVENAERYFDKHGAVGTFFGRLVPAVRQLISIPAGLARMNIARFFLYTTLGAGIWNCILAAMGWYIGRNYSGQLEEKVAEYSGELKIVMLVLGAAVVLYLAYKGLKK